jgi:hypothetical protein
VRVLTPLPWVIVTPAPRWAARVCRECGQADAAECNTRMGLGSLHLGEVVRAESDDAEVSGYEGQLRLLVVRHRRREHRVG